MSKRKADDRRIAKGMAPRNLWKELVMSTGDGGGGC